MVHASAQVSTTDQPLDSYVVLGLATCYLMQDGETLEVKIIEPVPSAYLETVLKGVATSYSVVWSTTLEEALAGSFSALSPEAQNAAQLCEDFEERLYAAARSYASRPQAKTLIPAGEPFQAINYSVEKKRVLNPKTKVLKSDNVKQHKYTHQVL